MTRPFTEIPAFVLGLYTDVRDVLFETASRVKDRISVEGKPVRYPIDWDSPRQQRYVMAKLRREGIPYKRTHAMRLGIKLERVPLGSNLSIPHPGGAVLGLAGSPSGWQSRIHRGRWVYLLEVLFEELGKIPAAIQNKFTVRGD